MTMNPFLGLMLMKLYLKVTDGPVEVRKSKTCLETLA